MRTEVEQLHAQNSNASHTQASAQPVTQNTSSHSAHRSHHSHHSVEEEEPSWLGEEGEVEDGVQRRGAEEARGLSRSQQHSSRASLDAEDRQKFGVLEVRLFLHSLLLPLRTVTLTFSFAQSQAQNQRLVDELVRLRRETIAEPGTGT